MPQFDILTYSSQLFWLTVVFGLLYLFASRYIIPKAEEIFAYRQDYIGQDLNYAESYSKESENLRKKYDEMLDQMHHDILQDKEREIRELEKKFEIEKQELAGQLKEASNVASQEIEKAKQDLLSKKRELVLELSAKMIERYSSRSPEDIILKRIYDNV